MNLSRQTRGATVEFSNVSFRYAREGFGIEDLSFRAGAGEFVGIVGPTGGGKSTVLDLVQGFYEPLSGRIQFDDHDIRDPPHRRPATANIRCPPGRLAVERHDPRKHYLPRNGARHGPRRSGRPGDAQLAEVHRVAAQRTRRRSSVRRASTCRAGSANASPSPAPYTGKQDSSCSTNPPPPSTPRTEFHLTAALDNLRQRSTLIVVAHRLKTVIDADKILVIDGGRIVESGPPQELIPFHIAEAVKCAGRLRVECSIQSQAVSEPHPIRIRFKLTKVCVNRLAIFVPNCWASLDVVNPLRTKSRAA